MRARRPSCIGSRMTQTKPYRRYLLSVRAITNLEWARHRVCYTVLTQLLVISSRVQCGDITIQEYKVPGKPASCQPQFADLTCLPCGSMTHHAPLNLSLPGLGSRRADQYTALLAVLLSKYGRDHLRRGQRGRGTVKYRQTRALGDAGGRPPDTSCHT